MAGVVKPLAIVYRHLKKTLPLVDRELDHWKRTAESIPEPALRHQALASIATKRFHCDGGSVFATWLSDAHERRGGSRSHDASSETPSAQVVRFIVAFQTISDYLDNLCDRTQSLSEVDFRQLHQAMFDAISLEAPQSQTGTDYYQFHPHQDDGGYLASLVAACRSVLPSLRGYREVQDEIRRLLALYVDLQVYKHLDPRLRVERLESWFSAYQSEYPELCWWEFAAAAGSTLAIFALVADASRDSSLEASKRLVNVYFPWVCGLHILLDYLIDQAEDKREGDLNFVSFYADEVQKENRLTWMLQEAIQGVRAMSDPAFHTTVVEGLLGLYLSDPKVRAQGLRGLARRMVRHAGWRTGVIRAVCRVWQRAKYGA